MPSWCASNSLWSLDIDPVKEVAFTPVISYKINNPKVIYIVINNIKALCTQLVQSYNPL